jgi:hypothetical protein
VLIAAGLVILDGRLFRRAEHPKPCKAAQRNSSKIIADIFEA